MMSLKRSMRAGMAMSANVSSSRSVRKVDTNPKGNHEKKLILSRHFKWIFSLFCFANEFFLLLLNKIIVTGVNIWSVYALDIFFNRCIIVVSRNVQKCNQHPCTIVHATHWYYKFKLVISIDIIDITSLNL